MVDSQQPFTIILAEAFMTIMNITVHNETTGIDYVVYQEEAAGETAYASTGDTIGFTVSVRNDGTGDALAIINIVDADTGGLIGSVTTPNLPAGTWAAIFPPYFSGYPFTMPNKNWNIIIEVGH